MMDYTQCTVLVADDDRDIVRAIATLLEQEGLDSPNAPGYLEILDEKTQRLNVLTENLFEAVKSPLSGITAIVNKE